MVDIDIYTLENENGSKASIKTYGGNCFSWKTKEGIEIMGVRKDVIKDDSKPYSGGVPHCFPQFGPGILLQHGFARGMKFIPGERTKNESLDKMTFILLSNEETKKIWNYEFEYRCDITLRENSLEWEIIITNLDCVPIEITFGLHDYYDISTLNNVVIKGPFLNSSTLDKLTGLKGVADSNEIRVTRPITMLYNCVNGPITITDTCKQMELRIENKGFPDIVVWSPYGDDVLGYDKFICVEAVQASPITIHPKECIQYSHKIFQFNL
jgi:glucose-6-phosphate 1-epimerase